MTEKMRKAVARNRNKYHTKYTKRGKRCILLPRIENPFVDEGRDTKENMFKVEEIMDIVETFRRILSLVNQDYIYNVSELIRTVMSGEVLKPPVFVGADIFKRVNHNKGNGIEGYIHEYMFRPNDKGEVMSEYIGDELIIKNLASSVFQINIQMDGNVNNRITIPVRIGKDVKIFILDPENYHEYMPADAYKEAIDMLICSLNIPESELNALIPITFGHKEINGQYRSEGISYHGMVSLSLEPSVRNMNPYSAIMLCVYLARILPLPYELKTDSLTGLPSREIFYRKLRRSINSIRCKEDRNKESKSIVVMCIDANNLKEINDTYGHHAGDKLIRSIANGIKNSIRSHARRINTYEDDSDIIARMGGDEFGVIVNISNVDTNAKEVALMVLKRIQDRIRNNTFWVNHEGKHIEIQPSVSIGAVVVDKDMLNIIEAQKGAFRRDEEELGPTEKVYSIADIAMYIKKRAIKSGEEGEMYKLMTKEEVRKILEGRIRGQR